MVIGGLTRHTTVLRDAGTSARSGRTERLLGDARAGEELPRWLTRVHLGTWVLRRGEREKKKGGEILIQVPRLGSSLIGVYV